MAIKTFTQAQLTASDLNTFASKGDTFIKSAAVTTGQILNCFSSAYENYRIVISDYYATVNGYLWMQLGYNSGATWLSGSYYQGGAYVAMSSPYGITVFNNNNTLPYFRICAGDTSANHMNNAFINISRPYTVSPTEYSCHTTLCFSGGLYAWNHAGKQNSSQFCDSIRWAADAGSVSAGTVSVYGVMQA
jgi:hypothetical protein